MYQTYHIEKNSNPTLIRYNSKIKFISERILSPFELTIEVKFDTYLHSKMISKSILDKNK